jgi:hypothetical protein
MSLSYLGVTGIRCDTWSSERIDLEKKGKMSSNMRGRLPKVSFENFQVIRV